MIHKIIKNKDLIVKVLSILAIALIIPDLVSLFAYDIKDSIYSLISVATVIACGILILVMSLSKKELTNKVLFIATILLFSGSIVTQARTLFVLENWISIYYIALYACIIIFFFILAFDFNEKVKIIVYMLFLITLTDYLLGVFTGSGSSLARLILGLIIIGNVYLNLNKGEEKETENEEN